MNEEDRLPNFYMVVAEKTRALIIELRSLAEQEGRISAETRAANMKTAYTKLSNPEYYFPAQCFMIIALSVINSTLQSTLKKMPKSARQTLDEDTEKMNGLLPSSVEKHFWAFYEDYHKSLGDEGTPLLRLVHNEDKEVK